CPSFPTRRSSDLEDRLAGAVELLDGGHEVPRLHELQQGRRLAPGDDEPLDVVELGRLSHLDRLDAAFLQRFGVEREVALEGEDPDPHRGAYQPRVCSSSFSGSLEVSSPTIASPRSSLTRASTSGSLK